MATKPSNDEVIEALTKDLNNTNMNDDYNGAFNNSQSLDTSSDNSPTNDVQMESNSGNLSETVDENEIIDEATLQDRDALLSDTEKDNFRTKAVDYKNDGNMRFKQGEFAESVILYSKALQTCPLNFTSDRSIFYANRAASKHKLDRKESAIEDCTKAVELNSSYVKAYLRRATLYEETEKLDEALNDYKKVLEFDSSNKEAISASMRLPQQINERNEKLKTEMMDKLKDLGNMVLKPFGLSTNNFKMSQDPSTGGYSINFVPNQ